MRYGAVLVVVLALAAATRTAAEVGQTESKAALPVLVLDSGVKMPLRDFREVVGEEAE